MALVGRKYIPRYEDIAWVDFSELPDEVVPKFAEMMRRAVERNVTRTHNMAPGEMRAFYTVDENKAKNPELDRSLQLRQGDGPTLSPCHPDQCANVDVAVFDRDDRAADHHSAGSSSRWLGQYRLAAPRPAAAQLTSAARPNDRVPRVQAGPAWNSSHSRAFLNVSLPASRVGRGRVFARLSRSPSRAYPSLSGNKEGTMLSRVISGLAHAAVASAAMLLLASGPSASFTLYSQSLDQPVVASGVEPVWWHHGWGWHHRHHYYGYYHPYYHHRYYGYYHPYYHGYYGYYHPYYYGYYHPYYYGYYHPYYYGYYRGFGDED
jgi:hypothetical protein